MARYEEDELQEQGAFPMLNAKGDTSGKVEAIDPITKERVLVDAKPTTTKTATEAPATTAQPVVTDTISADIPRVDVKGNNTPSNEKSDEQLEREYSQGASDAYNRGYDEQLAAYKKAHANEQGLIDSLGVSQERMDMYNKKREENERDRRRDALWRGLGTIVDMGIAAGHGNVYQRQPKAVDYERTRQLIDAQEQTEYAQAQRAKQDAQNKFDQRADQAARAGGDAALKGYIKEVDAAKKERMANQQAAWKADYQEKQMALKRELANKRASRSSSRSSSSSGGGGTNKDLVSINGANGAIKVSHAMLNDYYNSLIDVINRTETLNERGKKTHALKNACIRAGLLDENGNLTYGASQKIQAMMVNGGRPYPSFFDDYVSDAVREELINLWNDVLESGGATATTTTTTNGRSQSGRRTFSSSQGARGGSQGGSDVVI